MALPRNPSNLDLLLELKDVKNIALETRVLARKTNSRTDKLEDRTDKIESWQERLQAIEDYKLTHVSDKKTWQELAKQVLVVLTAMIAVIGTLVNFVVGE